MPVFWSHIPKIVLMSYSILSYSILFLEDTTDMFQDYIENHGSLCSTVLHAGPPRALVLLSFCSRGLDDNRLPRPTGDDSKPRSGLTTTSKFGGGSSGSSVAAVAAVAAVAVVAAAVAAVVAVGAAVVAIVGVAAAEGGG